MNNNIKYLGFTNKPTTNFL